MIKISIQNENEGSTGLYPKLDSLRQIIDVFQKGDEIEVEVKYKIREQAVECSPSITNPMVTD